MEILNTKHTTISVVQRRGNIEHIVSSCKVALNQGWCHHETVVRELSNMLRETETFDTFKKPQSDDTQQHKEADHLTQNTRLDTRNRLGQIAVIVRHRPDVSQIRN